MSPHYNFLFHFSEFRKPEEAWAYIHRDSLNSYWNGTSTENEYLPILGRTQEECMKKAIEKGYYTTPLR